MELLFPAVRGGVLLGAAMAIAFGILLWFRPLAAREINRRCSHWISTRRFEQALNRPRRIEPAVFRHHRFLGGLLIAGAGYWFAWLWQDERVRESKALAAAFGGGMPLVDCLYQAFQILVSMGCLAALPVGVVLFIRPSALRPAERWANRWVDWEGGARRLDVAHYRLDDFLFRKWRWTAAVQILCGAANFWFWYPGGGSL